MGDLKSEDCDKKRESSECERRDKVVWNAGHALHVKRKSQAGREGVDRVAKHIDGQGDVPPEVDKWTNWGYSLHLFQGEHALQVS